MTISYTREVATCSGLGVFWKLLFRWKGSIYKLVWYNLSVYLVLYFSLSMVYRFILNENGQEYFEQISLHCQRFSDLIPVTFVLGFYVSIIITRWWGQYKVIPWPDSCCLFISTCLQGHDDRGRLMRRTIARYLILALIQCLRMTSVQVKKRFPTLGHLCDAGIITESEQKVIESIDQKCIQHPKYWMSLVWAGAVVTRAKKEGRIKDDFAFNTIINEINKFRSGCGGLLDYDWISIPLVYTQVVTLAVYSFFISSLMGRQFLNPEKNLPGHEVDLIVPVFTFLQFFFYMGWLKVAEALINPFGEDDDDFEMNWLIDRNIQVAYLIVDDMHAEHPELVKDQYWDEGVPDELPYTVASEQFRTEPFIGSAMEVELSPEDQEIVILDRIDEEDDRESGLALNDIKIGENQLPTDPVTIQNGTTRNSFRSSNGTMRESIPSTLQVGSRRGSDRSVMGMLQKMLQRSSTNLSKIGSTFSVSSKAPNRTNTKRRRRRLPHNLSRASNLSSANMSPPTLSRIQTKENEIFKMSSNSSVNTFHTESEFRSRSNSDANALMAVRELLKNDLTQYQGSIKGDNPADCETKEGSKNSVNTDTSTRSFRARRRDLRSKSEAFVHTKMLKKKLEKVQAVQNEIMKELDVDLKEKKEELSRHSVYPEEVTDISDVVNLLETKTIELKKAIVENKDLAPDTVATSPTQEERSSPVIGMPSTSASYTYGDRLKTPLSLSVGLSTSPGSPSVATGPLTPLSSHQIAMRALTPTTPSTFAFTQPSSPDKLEGSQEMMFEIESPHNRSQDVDRDLLIDTGDSYSPRDSVDIPGTSRSQEPGETIEMEEDWDPNNLGTIQELPELGYQSDSSDTDQLLTKQRKKSLVREEEEEDTDPLLLETVPEDKPI